jgi:adenylate cyclase
MLLVVVIYVGITFYKYFTEERKKKYLKATFSKYVSPAIVDETLKDPENVQLGGRKQRMSVFFSDVRNFTTISEKLDPQMLSSVLNEYLTPMTYIVFNNKGTLDKYMGDAVMAFFGAPLFYEDHAKYACRCALQSIDKLKEIQADFEKRGYPKIDIGIGINTYDMSVGNMGSDIVRSYTVMGDGVNLGSRLEGLNKEYGSRILISEFTYEDVSKDFTCREIDWVRVKGKLQPIKIYELICEGAPSAAQATMLQLFAEGYQLYRDARFTEAVAAFKKAVAENPDDPVAVTYLERCEELSANPPPAPWDGVFTMKTK